MTEGGRLGCARMRACSHFRHSRLARESIRPWFAVRPANGGWGRSGPRAAGGVGFGFPRARERRKGGGGDGGRVRGNDGEGVGGDGGTGVWEWRLGGATWLRPDAGVFTLPSFPPCAGIHSAGVRGTACKRGLGAFGSRCCGRGWVWVPACAGTTGGCAGTTGGARERRRRGARGQRGVGMAERGCGDVDAGRLGCVRMRACSHFRHSRLARESIRLWFAVRPANGGWGRSGPGAANGVGFGFPRARERRRRGARERRKGGRGFGGGGAQRSIDAEDFHYLVAQVVDYFYGDAAGIWAGEGAGRVAVEGFPGLAVDFRL